MSSDQTLSYWTGSAVRQELVRVDRTGKVIGTIGQPQENLIHPTLSPDGNWVAFSAVEDGNRDIWLQHVESANKIRLSFSEARDIFPVWTASGERLAFHRVTPGGNEIWIRPVDSSREAQKLTDGNRPHFSLDGRFLVFDRESDEAQTRTATTDHELWSVEMGREGEPKHLPVGEDGGGRPRLSPNSRWLAYTVVAAGKVQVYVKKFPSLEGKWLISNNGGDRAWWSPNGDELFYLEELDLMAVSIGGSDSLTHGIPKKLFTLPAPELNREYAVGRDGETFIVPRPVESDGAIAIVHNWFSEFRDRQ